jgi:16S rRNA (guanine966-N2)-methyltransferase
VALAMLLAAGALAAPHPYHVTDLSQADRPTYELTFPKPLRKGTVYAGSAHDDYTDRDIRVHLRLTRSGRIVNFRGPAADTTQPSFPIRAAFYYAWYPDEWWAGAFFPYSFFRPTLGYYSDVDAAVVPGHTRALLYAHLDAGIYSWWGFDGDPPTDLRFSRYLAAARTTPLRWALYYEREGYGDPSVAEIRADLERIRDTYAAKPAYLKVAGRFVVYVYGDPHDGCATAARWHEANTVGAYIVLKAFAGFRDCADQPDAWHEYSAAGVRAAARLVHGRPRLRRARRGLAPITAGRRALAPERPGHARVERRVAARAHVQRMARGDIRRERARVGDTVRLRGLPRRPPRAPALMRIIAGERKGHTIYAPKGLETRPTSDRVRENVFNIVAPWVEGARVLDLYAGSGAMGLEALSRGAAAVVFVESDRDAVRAIERNLDKLRLTGAMVVRADATTGLAQETAAGRKYDLVLADPPYAMTDYDTLARYLSRALADDGLLVLETAARTEPELAGLTVRTSRKYGSTRVTVFEHA